MLDDELVEEYLASLADKYEAAELCELLELDVWDIIEMFRERCIELKWR